MRWPLASRAAKTSLGRREKSSSCIMNFRLVPLRAMTFVGVGAAEALEALAEPPAPAGLGG